MIPWFRIGLGVAAIAAILGWLWLHDRQVIAQDRLEATVEAQQRDAAADDRAGRVAASQAATIEQENARAREVAAGSDDPLKSGFDSLRAGKAGDR